MQSFKYQESLHGAEIAIIGMNGRFPGAENRKYTFILAEPSEQCGIGFLLQRCRFVVSWG